MFLFNFSGKNFLKLVLIFEIFITILIVTGILPREFSFSATAAIILYILGASVKNSLILAILSIPFYLALPITAYFDTMASWRIIILVLFLKIFFEKFNIKHLISDIKQANTGYGVSDIKKRLLNENSRLEVLALIFAAISFISLIGANNISAGIKKIVFLANIFILFTITKNIVRDKETFLEISKACLLAGFFSLIIGYAQITSILFYSLADFWQFWANNAIAALYGKDLSNLLSYSNTWFSYYPGDIPPTLRMFSVFPDSHSFALFNIILAPFALGALWHYKKQNNGLFAFYLLFFAALLLAIIFSGSRGAWVSAIAPLSVILILKRHYILNKYKKIKIRLADNSKRPLADGKQNFSFGIFKSGIVKIKTITNDLIAGKFKALAASLVLFFLLFPVSSVFLEQIQKAEWRRLNSEGDFSSFAMYKRLKSIIDLDEISNKGRIEIWRDTLTSIKNHPVLGVGAGNFTTVIGKKISAAKKGASAHNLFLDIFAETGILGLAAFLAIFYEILKNIFFVFKKSTDETYKFFALSAGIYFFWVLGYAVFDVVLFNDKVLMLFMLMIGVLYGIKNSIQKDIYKPER